VAGLGWTFKRPGEHPWIVVSDPAQCSGGWCLCINLTDPANYFLGDCVLEAGCHPLVTKDSVLYYPEALETTSDAIDDKIARGKFERKQNMEGALLRKVINACRQTKHLPGKYRHHVQQA
jgi:hypothetical protein